MFKKTCLTVVSFALLFAGVARGEPLVVNNGFVCPTRETVTAVVEYERSIIKEGTGVAMEKYDHRIKGIGCATIFGVAIEKHEEVLRYTGVYPIAETWVPVDVVVVYGNIRRLDAKTGIDGFVFLPASTKFPGETAI